MLWDRFVQWVLRAVAYVGLPLLAIAGVVLAVVFFALVPGAGRATLPFAGVLLGIGWGAFVPYLIKALEQIGETGEWLRFERRYWVPPLAAFLIQVVGFTGTLLSFPGAFERVSALGFVAAVALGRGGKEAIRDLQKVYEALRRSGA